MCIICRTGLGGAAAAQLAAGRTGPDSATLCVTSPRGELVPVLVLPIPAPDDAGGPSVAEAVDRFLHSLTAATTRAGYAASLAHLSARAGDRPAAELERWTTTAAAT
ncbi:hypothetical protein GCM10010156_72880 [Planobispora rosea]|uniref:Uncharacterized protein n=1 Tax=Planobispora rosea TaxID=35762 RepID=A0A8J3SA79_PLARO|nr:hypothetical protein GCM10010156_72880 [Planobispora rosea]GIH88900.1 hypothetical protein Pro02_73080 [Planobispora rosea]